MRGCLIALMSFFYVMIAFAQHAPQTPGELYQAQAMDVIEHAVLPEWGKHMDKLDGGTLTFHYRVYPDGRVTHLKITSTTGNRFLEEISLRRMQGVKLPPVPPAVLGDEPWLEMETQMKPQVGRSNQAMELTATRRMFAC